MSECTSSYSMALGFIAGEGAFCITKQRGSNKPYVGIRFDLQVDSKDEELVREMRDLFGVGTVRVRERADGREHVAWTVTGKDSLEQLRDTIVEHVGSLWKSSEKCKNFNVWSRALDIYLDGKTTGDDQIRIAELAKDVNADFGGGWDEFIRERQS